MTAEGKLCITASSLKKTHPDKIVPMGPSYKLINQNIYLCPHSSTLPFLSFLKLIFSTWYFWVSEQILCHGYRPHSKVVESAPLDQMMTWSVISPEGPRRTVQRGLSQRSASQVHSFCYNWVYVWEWRAFKACLCVLIHHGFIVF